MAQKRNHTEWSKEELIREILALKKQKTYGLVWEREKTIEKLLKTIETKEKELKWVLKCTQE